MGRLKNKAEHTSRRMPLFCRVVTFLWMGLIFAFSAQDASGSSQLSGQTAFHAAFWFWPGFSGLSAESQAVWVESVQFLVRKAAHFFVYTVLGILLYWDFIPSCGSVRKKVGWVWAAGTAYAVSDEIHQLFVPGRSGQVRDVLLDSVGVAAGILLSCKSYKKWGPILRPLNGLKRGKVNVEQRQSGEDWLEWPPLGAKKTRRKEPGGWKVLFSCEFLHPDKRPADVSHGW